MLAIEGHLVASILAMINEFSSLNAVLQALLAGCFTWLVTAGGSSLVFATKKVKQRLLDAMLGFAAGVMIAASFWSLLVPSISMSEGKGLPSWIPPAAGFLLGAIFLSLLDKVLPHLHIGFPNEQAEGVKTSWDRTLLLVAAITLHNIPEGLAVGVAFGALSAGLPQATLAGAIALTIGIAIQNFPEGFAVSVSLRRENVSILKSFTYGHLSAVVEPVAAVIGATAVLRAAQILPYAMAFAAGAMIFVVVEEVIPESQRNGNSDLATAGAILGFVVMMILDVGLS